MLQLVDIDAVVPGMYVVKVTKQAGKIKVTKAGKINDLKDTLELIKRGILQVQIDLSKSEHLDSENTLEEPDDIYTNAAGLTYNQQLEHALVLHDQAKAIQERLIKRVAKGKVTDLEEINQITEQIVTSAFECDDALAISTLLKDNDEYLLEHSINCAILIILFGRALGMDKTILRQLGIGALLMDIGMAKMPMLMTQKPDSLTPQETLRMERHVEFALKLIDPIEGVSQISRTVIEQHHERLDGSGYPAGLSAEQISEYGKMAAIVDAFDALTSKRPFREALKPAEALKHLAEEEAGLDKHLIEIFISCVGANPVGSLVTLASGKLAMVMRLNKHQPLSPVVMVFYNLNTKLDEVAQIDLSKTDDKIIGSVSPEDFGMELSSFLTQSFFKSK
jgi:HD-GYP domain-containing protein (c-di-GMP phosphodiesterase class II)